jgi:NADH-quinone oxidoreductase subunit M
MYQKVFYGQITREQNRTLPDLDGREQISLWPVAVMALVMGVLSPYWMRTIDPAVVNIGGQQKTAAATPASAASAGGQK